MEVIKTLPDIFEEFGDQRRKSFLHAYEIKQKNIPFVGTFCTYTPNEVIMAAGAFVQGSTIELSADAPMREPYIAYFQGGLTYEHAKFGVIKAADTLLKDGLLTIE